MSTSKEYIAFVCDQLRDIDGVTYKKMFGEYLVYVREKPLLLVCDNCVMVKKVPALAELMKDAPDGLPYEGAKVHSVLDIEDRALVAKVIETLSAVTPLPKRKKKSAV